MHNERIYEIHIAWLNNHNEAGLCLPEDVVNMSVCLLDINEQMYPVTTTLMATNQTMRFMTHPLVLQGCISTQNMT